MLSAMIDGGTMARRPDSLAEVEELLAYIQRLLLEKIRRLETRFVTAQTLARLCLIARPADSRHAREAERLQAELAIARLDASTLGGLILRCTHDRPNGSAPDPLARVSASRLEEILGCIDDIVQRLLAG